MATVATTSHFPDSDGGLWFYLDADNNLWLADSNGDLLSPDDFDLDVVQQDRELVDA